MAESESFIQARPAPGGILGAWPLVRALRRLGPGVLLCFAVTFASDLLARIEALVFGRAWIEALVLAILLGTALRTLWTPGERWNAGLQFSAKTLLEIAVCLLGAGLSIQTILAGGADLPLGIAALVALTLCASYGIGRLVGLPARMALLIACGNSICGNSAIAAIAPVIGAEAREIAAAIAFTAVLGVAVVIGLPFLAPLLSMSQWQYGALAGLSVYAVPQVLAATVPVGATAVQMGTLVKLMRVLMLGPVALVLALGHRRQAKEAAANGTAAARGSKTSWPFLRFVPWFILGFVALALCRSAGFLPPALLAPVSSVASFLTVVAMAALGLSTDLASVARAGPRASLAVALSLLLLGLLSFALIRLLGIP